MATMVESQPLSLPSLEEAKKLRKTHPSVAHYLIKKLKKKKRKTKLREEPNGALSSAAKYVNDVKHEFIKTLDEKEDLSGIDIHYVPSDFGEMLDGEFAGYFDEVIQKFTETFKEEIAEEDKAENSSKLNFKENEEVHSDDDEDDADENAPRLSKKQLKLLNRPTVAHLKQAAARPEVVEAWDTAAAEPYFLVSMKSLRNTVAVPLHWNQKRKYMQGKRGVEKVPFRLPDYIEATKISEIRQSLQEKEANKTLKQKQREKARPKSHRMDIDYQVLHDAFFKYATKPKLTRYGDIFYEGKENEMRMKRFKPGKISDELKRALGMYDNSPPPWLLNMQRYGPPPSFSGLKIPGLNCPILKGCEYGYHPGGWGKPPTDEFGNPLFGDFRFDHSETDVLNDDTLWGELASDQEEEEEEEEEETEETEEKAEVPQTDGMQTPSVLGGSETPLLEGMASVGGTSVTSGLETPASVDIRRRGFSSAGLKPYTVLQQREAPLQPGALFSSNITYKIPQGGMATPLSGAVTPLGGMITPTVGGMITPFAMGGTQTPTGGGPFGYSGSALPLGGMITPTAGTSVNLRPSGIATSEDPRGSGVTVNLNPAEMEQEGMLTADVIRQQLKQHEEQAVSAKRAAGQVDHEELRKRKNDPIMPHEAAKKKKKKEFKF